mgnify:CR=1 FL=1
MKLRLFPYIIALSALAVSASAAAYSVYGLSKLFAGASLAVMIMAGSLEFAKLVIASALYQYWSKINKYIKTYLLFAILVLITITSGGIYGFLSGAYQETANQSELISKNLNILETKQNRYINRLKDIETNISDLTIALSNPTKIQYVDKETGQLVTTTSYTQRKVLEKQLIKAQTTFDALTDSVSIYDTRILEIESNNEIARELGPLKYMASLFNKPMESIINWFMLLIIFVFDPLAIVLVVVANMAFSQKSISKSNQYFNARNKALEKMVEQHKPKAEEKIIEYKNNPIVLETLIKLIHRNPEFSKEFEEKLKNEFYGEENK